MQKLLSAVVLTFVLAGCGATGPAIVPQATMSTVTAKSNPQVAAAKTEIKRQIEMARGAYYRRFESLGVSPTPLGTVFTFRGVMVEGNLEGEKRFDVTGTYNVMDDLARITKQTEIAAK